MAEATNKGPILDFITKFDGRWIQWGLKHIDEVGRIPDHIALAWEQATPRLKVMGFHPVVDELADIADDCPAFNPTLFAAEAFGEEHFAGFETEITSHGIDVKKWLDRLAKLAELMQKLAPFIVLFLDDRSNP